MGMPSIATVHHVVETVVNPISFVLNVCVFFIVYKCPNLSMKLYTRVLLVSSALDICLSVFVFLSQPVILIDDGLAIAFSNGFFSTYSGPLCYALIAAWCALLNANIVCIETQFFFRYLLICGDHKSNRTTKRLVALVVMILFALGVAIPSWALYTPRETKPVVFSVLPNNNWPQDYGKPPFVFGAHITDPQMLVMVIYCSLHIGCGYAMICWCEYRIFKFLQQADSEVYKQTRRMHAEVHRALLALAISPLISVVMPCFFLLICEALGASPGLFTVFVTGFSTSVTLINPLTTVVFVRPYRRAVQKMFCSGKLISPSQMWSGSGRTVLQVRRGTISNIHHS